MPRFARNSISPVGGTVVSEKSKTWPVVAIVVGVIVVLFIGWQVKNAFDDYRRKGAAIGHRDAGVTVDPSTARPAPSINDSLTANQPPPPPPPPTTPTIRADDVAKSLEKTLKQQRLWSTVTVTGDHVEIRSANCADAGMKQAVDGVVASFHAAGLTKLRCLEQSGGVVFARDL